MRPSCNLGALHTSRLKGVFISATKIKSLTHEDIRDLLIGFAAAIELDQIRVDALPPEKFHRWYSDGMWRRWRRGHLDYINRASYREHDPVGPARRTGLLAITHDRQSSRKRQSTFSPRL